MRSLRNDKPRGSSIASTSMSTTGRCKRRVVLLRQPSHEEHHDGLNQYCYYNLVASWWKTWSEVNPSRRFYGCRDYNKVAGCGFFEWQNVEFGERATAVIKDLLNDKLYEENNQLRRGNDRARLYEEMVAIEGDVRKLKAGDKVRETKVRKGAVEVHICICNIVTNLGVVGCNVYLKEAYMFFLFS